MTVRDPSRSLSAIAYGALGANRKKLAQSEPKLVTSLVQLMESPSLKVQCQAALALRNLASDGADCPYSAVVRDADLCLQRNISLR